ncbi:MAG TPA: GxxExxY protein [Anaerolineales bacterium]|nr:GxxExxY protein [Anaerolineales bacterium]
MEPKKKFEGRYSELTGRILGAFFELHKELGFGFSEKIYETALEVLLTELGLIVEKQKDIFVYFHGRIIGEYKADMVINGVVLLEIKSVERLIDAHDAQLLNYLKATEVEVGLLLNFGRQAEFRRKIYDNPRKGSLSWAKIP